MYKFRKELYERQGYPINLLIIVLGLENENEIERYKSILSETWFNERYQNASLSLTDKERQVIKMRFQDFMSLDSVGKSLGGVSRERIRQLELKAIKKLMRPGNKRYFEFDSIEEYIRANSNTIASVAGNSVGGILDNPIDNSPFMLRKTVSKAFLKDGRFCYVRDLYNATTKDILSVYGVSYATLYKIDRILSDYGYPRRNV